MERDKIAHIHESVDTVFMGDHISVKEALSSSSYQ